MPTIQTKIYGTYTRMGSDGTVPNVVQGLWRVKFAGFDSENGALGCALRFLSHTVESHYSNYTGEDARFNRWNHHYIITVELIYPDAWDDAPTIAGHFGTYGQRANTLTVAAQFVSAADAEHNFLRDSIAVGETYRPLVTSAGPTLWVDEQNRYVLRWKFWGEPQDRSRGLDNGGVVTPHDTALSHITVDWGDGSQVEQVAVYPSQFAPMDGTFGREWRCDVQLAHTFTPDEHRDGSGNPIVFRGVDQWGRKSYPYSVTVEPDADFTVGFEPETGFRIVDTRLSFGRTGKLSERRLWIRMAAVETPRWNDSWRGFNGSGAAIVQPALDLDSEGRVFRLDLPTGCNYGLALDVKSEHNAVWNDRLFLPDGRPRGGHYPFGEHANGGLKKPTSFDQQFVRLACNGTSHASLVGGAVLRAREAFEFVGESFLDPGTTFPLRSPWEPRPKLEFKHQCKRWTAYPPSLWEYFRQAVAQGQITPAQYEQVRADNAERSKREPWHFGVWAWEAFQETPREPLDNLSSPSLAFRHGATYLCARRLTISETTASETTATPPSVATWLFRSHDEGRTWDELVQLWSSEYFHAAMTPLAGGGVATVAFKRAPAPPINGQPQYHLQLWSRFTLDVRDPDKLSAPVLVATTEATAGQPARGPVIEHLIATHYPQLVNEALAGGPQRLLAFVNSFAGYPSHYGFSLYESLDLGRTWRVVRNES